MPEETESARIEHLFVIRMWQESNLMPTGTWRGSVEHIPTKQRLYFTSFGDLNDFIQWRLNSASLHDESGEE